MGTLTASAHAQVGGHAGKHVGLLATQPTLGVEPPDHLAQRASGRQPSSPCPRSRRRRRAGSRSSESRAERPGCGACSYSIAGNVGRQPSVSARRSDTSTVAVAGDLDRGTRRPRPRPGRSARRRSTAARPGRGPAAAAGCPRAPGPRRGCRRSRAAGSCAARCDAYGSTAGTAEQRLGTEHRTPRSGRAPASRAVARSNSSRDGATATQPRNGRPWIAIPGICVDRATPSLDLPATRKVRLEHVARARRSRGPPRSSRSRRARSAWASTTSTSPGARPADLDRAGQRMVGVEVDGLQRAGVTRGRELLRPSRRAARARPPRRDRSLATGSRSGQIRLWLLAGLTTIDLCRSTAIRVLIGFPDQADPAGSGSASPTIRGDQVGSVLRDRELARRPLAGAAQVVQRDDPQQPLAVRGPA